MRRCEYARAHRNWWLCRCKCGGEIDVQASHLKNGNNKTCGCRSRRKNRQDDNRTRHPLYGVWLTIKARCRHPENHKFHRYGARGIDICDEWHDDFWLFVEGVGPRPGGFEHDYAWSLDRIDNDGDYEPGNVKWSTPLEQRHNQGDTL